uniref:Hint domain-containing protein n=1 Tax=Chromera velia CCMP2878 TaxID=1169474 RepID=A0A0G4HJB7_9ALVE|eukprot:Cvel_7056.t1-p1 / transcript=Cvel_7056.t1 / gene=Cvel_7056 / organism=Chromera_velia_CCMP2878 / gene_product=Desert hedgehog protein B, putative / transcript_product=Desert hedgehog protein B, putative / location=Cvel_scaffold360:84185-87076(+) / protein_length=510 / sequence_SO=supercontig / SO=protein_coding / is_pseudo=false
MTNSQRVLFLTALVLLCVSTAATSLKRRQRGELAQAQTAEDKECLERAFKFADSLDGLFLEESVANAWAKKKCDSLQKLSDAEKTKTAPTTSEELEKCTAQALDFAQRNMNFEFGGLGKKEEDAKEWSQAACKKYKGSEKKIRDLEKCVAGAEGFAFAHIGVGMGKGEEGAIEFSLGVCELTNCNTDQVNEYKDCWKDKWDKTYPRDLRKVYRGGCADILAETKPFPVPAEQPQSSHSSSGSGGEPTAVPSNDKSTSGFCFPGSASFLREDGAKVRADGLKVGDRVKVVTESGQVRYEEIIFFAVAAHAPPERIPMLRLKTASGHELHLTGTHFLPVVPKEKQSGLKPSEVLVKASQVKAGDAVWVHSASFRFRSPVVSVDSDFGNGLFAPVPLSSSRLVVDGVETSAWGTWFLTKGHVPEQHSPVLYSAARTVLLRPLFALIGAERMHSVVSLLWAESGVMWTLSETLQQWRKWKRDLLNSAASLLPAFLGGVATAFPLFRGRSSKNEL